MKPKFQNSRRTKPLRVTFFTFILTLMAFTVINSCKKDEEATFQTHEPENNSLVVKNGTNTNGSVIYYEHEIFTRTTGQPNLFTRQIENPLFPYFTNEFVLKICNGIGTNNRVSSAIIKIDGVQIVGPSDFSQNVDSIFKPIPNLTSNSTLEVDLRGSPGGSIDLWIEGEYLPNYFDIRSEGGEISFYEGSILLTIPSDALPSYGLSFLGFTGNEPTSDPNPDLQIVGAPITLQLPATELLKPIQLTYPIPSGDINEENYAVFLFNGTSYFPVEYTIEGNNVIVNIDIINWESNSTKSFLSDLIILGFMIEQTPPTNVLGLKEISLDSNNEMQYNTISNTNSSSKIALFVHGFTGSPSIWNSLIPKMKNDGNLSYTHYWTFGYKSSNSIQSTGQLLKQLLAASANGAQIDVIAHSMGGLVSRAMIELCDGEDLVKRLVTIGTPHHGSPLAALRYYIGSLVSSYNPLDIVTYLMNTQGLRDLYPNSSFIEQMMEQTTPPVPYYTIACRNNGILNFMGSSFIAGPDDGVVAVSSALGVPNAGAPDNLIVDGEGGCAHTRMTRNNDIQDQVIDYLKAVSSSGTVTDIDGNVYQTVVIGNQEWMAENLKVTHYRNGDEIPNVTENTQWRSLSTGAYCYYNNDISWKDAYGALYNWYAVVDNRKLCPAGWHTPTDAEWTVLTNYLGGGSIAGGKMKSTRTEPDAHPRWSSPNSGATNESGFSGFPAGHCDSNGSFNVFGWQGLFWSSSELDYHNAMSRSLYYVGSSVYRTNSNKRNGFPVRCLRD